MYVSVHLLIPVFRYADHESNGFLLVPQVILELDPVFRYFPICLVLSSTEIEDSFRIPKFELS